MKKLFILLLFIFLTGFLYANTIKEYDFMDKVGQSGYNTNGFPPQVDNGFIPPAYSGSYTPIGNGYCYQLSFSATNGSYVYVNINRQSHNGTVGTTRNNYIMAGTNLSIWLKVSSGMIGKQVSVKLIDTWPNHATAPNLINHSTSWSNWIIPLSSFTPTGTWSITNIQYYSFATVTACTGQIWVDRVGFTSDTIPETGTPNNSLAPITPSGLNATTVSSNKIALSWVEVGNETSYTLFRNINNNSNTAANIGGTAASITIFTDKTVTPHTTYHYWVRAYNNYGYRYTGGLLDTSTNSKFSNYSPSGWGAGTSNSTNISPSSIPPTSVTNYFYGKNISSTKILLPDVDLVINNSSFPAIGSATDITITFYNTFGKEISTLHLNDIWYSQNRQSLKAGMYFYKITSNNAVINNGVIVIPK